jgi:type IV pilus assembly protein PilN
MTAIRLNLLPHREQRRARLRRQFWVFVAGALAVALLVAVTVHGVLETMVDAQAARNEFLKQEIARVDKQIEAVRRLREDIDALIARKKIIETLQTDRGQSVAMLDELARQVPDGVYLRSIRQEGRKLNVTGVAQTNARVSSLMRNLEDSAVFESPVLVEVRTIQRGARRLADFTMTATLRAVPSSSAPAAAPAKG